MTTDQTTQPLDLEPCRARAADAKAAVDQIRHAGPADLVAHGLKAALSAADVPGLIAEVEQLRAVNQRVRELHRPGLRDGHAYLGICTGCGTEYPCRTMQALAGEAGAR